MEDDCTAYPRRFICGNCYIEFSTLPELTHHAELCFSSDQYTTPFHHLDETFLAVESLTTNDYETTISADNASAPASRLFHGQSGSKFISNDYDYEDLLLSSSSSTLPSKSTARLPKSTDRIKVRGKALCLDGIQVTHEASSTAFISEGNDGIRANDTDETEYRGSARSTVHPTLRKIHGKDDKGRGRNQKNGKEPVMKSIYQGDCSVPLYDLDGLQPVDNELNIIDEAFGEAASGAGHIQLCIDEDLSLRNGSTDAEIRMERNTISPRCYKATCTGLRQKWRYLPVDVENLRLPNGHVKKSYRIHCPVCNKALWRQNLHHHMRSHTGQKPYKCSQCPKTFTGSTDLKKHLLTHEDSERRILYHCPFCTWSGMTNLRRHVRTKHQGADYDPAAVCTSTLADRQEMHTTASDFISTINCGTSKEDMVVESVFEAVMNGTFQPSDDDVWEAAIEHVEEQLRSDPMERLKTWETPRIECNICWRVMRRSNFADHRRIHERAKPFQCSICNRAFRYRKWLVDHLNEHSRRKPHACDVCGYQFTSPAQLRLHRKKKHRMNGNMNGKDPLVPWRIRKSACHVCGVMVSQPKMATHLKRHNEGLEFHACDQCPKRYQTAYFLRLHKARDHERVLPYKCLKCDFRASRRDPVVSHMLDVHQEIVDRNVVLVQGITTINHLPTKKCPVCAVHVFQDNYLIHRKKHTHPEEYERLRKTKESAFRRLIYEQRVNRNPDRMARRTSSSRIGSESRTSTQRTAKRILDGIKHRSNAKRASEVDHDYVGITVGGRNESYGVYFQVQVGISPFQSSSSLVLVSSEASSSAGVSTHA